MVAKHKITGRQIRLHRLRNWREGIAKYSRFCALSGVHKTRVSKWQEGDPTYAFMLLHRPYDDRITDAVINAAMRIEAEIALHLNIAFWDGLESLGTTLGKAVSEEAYRAVVDVAQKRMSDAEQTALFQLRRTGTATIHIPHLIEAAEVAQLLNLTMLRKAVIWGKSLQIRAIDLPLSGKGYASSRFTIEQHREHRRLAKLYDRKPETIADWERLGPEPYAEKVAKMEALLRLAASHPEARRGDEHPIKTGKRVLREMKKDPRPTRNSKSARVKLQANNEGVSERTIWRRLATQEKRAKSPTEPSDP